MLLAAPAGGHEVARQRRQLRNMYRVTFFAQAIASGTVIVQNPADVRWVLHVSSILTAATRAKIEGYGSPLQGLAAVQ